MSAPEEVPLMGHEEQPEENMAEEQQTQEQPDRSRRKMILTGVGFLLLMCGFLGVVIGVKYNYISGGFVFSEASCFMKQFFAGLSDFSTP